MVQILSLITRLIQEFTLSQSIADVRFKYFQEFAMSLTDAIARLETLSVRIENAVGVEAAQADALTKRNSEAVAALSEALEMVKTRDETIEELRAMIAANESADPSKTEAALAQLAQLNAAVSRLENAAKSVSEIVVEANVTPVTDLVVGSVTADTAPTPHSVPEVPVFATVPTSGGSAASDAIGEAVKEVVDNAVA